MTGNKHHNNHILLSKAIQYKVIRCKTIDKHFHIAHNSLLKDKHTALNSQFKGKPIAHHNLHKYSLTIHLNLHNSNLQHKIHNIPKTNPKDKCKPSTCFPLMSLQKKTATLTC